MNNLKRVRGSVPIKKSSTDLIFHQHDYGINTMDRIVYLEDEISLYTPSIVRERIGLVTSISKDYKTPITMIISSYGGDVHGMFGTLDIIRQMSMPIYTLGIGAVMSAAAFIMAAGAKGHRKIGKHTNVMLHQLSSMIGGDSTDIVNEADYISSLQTAVNNLLAEHTCKTRKFWAQRTNKNLYLSPLECKEYGLVDEII